MPKLLSHSVSPPAPCAYLPQESASLENRLMLKVGPEDWEPMLMRGWRRFGPTYFRPACEPCRECVSIRVPVTGFTPTRSQHRALRKCGHLRLEVAPPVVDDERVALYRAWHGTREAARGWHDSSLDAESYAMQFAFPHPCAREFAYYDGERLVALGICDVTPGALSSVYFFFHPDVARLSVGVASVCREVAWAREHGLEHVYLGYRVLGCPSLRYKADYGPHELLRGRPGPTEPPEWLPGRTP